jgi:hypothetical protein
VLRLRLIETIVAQNREGWRLTKNTTVKQFIEYLIQSGRLRTIKFEFPIRTETLYIWGYAPFPEILQHLKPNCYLSHYSAMSFHSLTEQTPTTFYVTAERSADSRPSGELTQEYIDHAFAKPVNTTSSQIVVDGHGVVLISGMATGIEGVENIYLTDDKLGDHYQIKATGLERTLIDAVVRPNYCGGVGEVLKAFERAQAVVSINTLCAQLRHLNFLYPYHQAIGFYMQRAGYSSKQLDLVRKFPCKFDFYLTKGIEDKEFDSTWRIFHPRFF